MDIIGPETHKHHNGRNQPRGKHHRGRNLLGEGGGGGWGGGGGRKRVARCRATDYDLSRYKVVKLMFKCAFGNDDQNDTVDDYSYYCSISAVTAGI